MRAAKSSHYFSRVPNVSIPRSSFRRDRTYKTAFDAGKLVPFYLDEVLPGDTFNVQVTAFARLSTPVVPFMDNLYLDFFFFFVPNRLVWEHWVNFCGEQEDPGDSTDYLIPVIETDSDSIGVGTQYDYLGLPVGVSGISFSALPFRGISLIWNEFFRDENLQESLQVLKDDGPDPFQDYEALLPRGKRKDYFTGALPWPQKGPGIELPIGGNVPVVGDGNALLLTNNPSNVTSFYTLSGTIANVQTGQRDQNGLAVHNHQSSLNPFPLDTTGMIGSSQGTFGVINKSQSSSMNRSSGLVADLSEASAVTINSLRQAFQIQRLLERDALGGSRYFETLVAHFGVRSPDARLQRPEYLGGGHLPVNVHTVTQTSATDDVTPQGNLAAVGVAGGRGIGFVKSFVEHGYVFGFVCARADLTYQQGIDRHWSRKTRFDFYWPALAHLGEQAILNKEIYAQGTAADDDVFGYQERWAEYRYGINKITGKLRSGVSGSLDVWHLSQYFDRLPTLSADFIKEQPPVERVLAVQNEPQFIFDSLISCNCVRPMPVYSVPGLIDHF